MRAKFRINEGEINIDVFCSSWSGLQIYKVNGEVVRKIRSFKPNDVVEFKVGKYDEYEVKVILKSLPKVSSQVYINDELYVEELFDFSCGVANKEVNYRDNSCIKSVITFVSISMLVGFFGRVFIHYSGKEIPEFFGVFVVLVGAVSTHYLFKTSKFPWFSCERDK